MYVAQAHEHCSLLVIIHVSLLVLCVSLPLRGKGSAVRHDLHTNAVRHLVGAPQLSLRKRDMDHITNLCMDKRGFQNEAVTLSGLWLMKQLSPNWYNGLNGSAVASAILAGYVPPAQAHSHFSSTCEDASTMAILDMWWFAAMPGGFEVSGKEPGSAWLACLHRKLWSFARQPAAALKKQPARDVLERYIQAIELQQLQQDIYDVQRMVRQLYSQAETFFFC